jgi:hypothetical protein
MDGTPMTSEATLLMSGDGLVLVVCGENLLWAKGNT